MYPILYENISNGTVPAHNGLGVLSDCISCIIEQERNGAYELTMEYPRSGIHAEELGYRRIIKAKPNFTDNPQLFRIDRIGKEMNGKFTVYAKHISYDLSGFPIISGEANNAASACVLLQGAASGYSITTDKTVAADFRIDAPASVKSFFAGKKGSFLDIYGPAEIKYDNFSVAFLAHAGEDRGVTIRYSKNLLELSQEIDASKLYTAVLCFYKPQDGSPISGEQVATGLTLDTDRVLIIDCTSEYQEAPTPEELTARATRYKNENITSLTVPSNNITLDFIQSGELANRVDLCDTVTVYYEALGITREEVKCIRTKWDCLREKYIETEFGDAKQSLSDTVTQVQQETAEAGSAATSAINIANSKKRVFMEEPVPPYDIGDLWLNDGTIYNCVEGKEQTIIKEASGPVATFESEINADLIKCEADISFQQDLHGYSKPWAGGTGKNLLNYDEWEAVSIARGTAVWENNGVTLTATSADCYTNPWGGDFPINARIPVTEGETYTLSWKETTNTAGLVIIFPNATTSGMVAGNNNTVKKISYTATSGITFITFRFGVTNSGNTISYKDIQLEKGSTATSWEPYANVCPIIGYNEANISRTGKNLAKFVSNGYIDWSGNYIQSNPNGLCPVLHLKNGEAVTISKGEMYSFGYIVFVNNAVTYRRGSVGTASETYTATANCDVYVWFNINSGTNSQQEFDDKHAQFEKGTEATDYEAYSDEVFNIDIRTSKGVNLWDEEWEQGGINTDTGLPVTDNSKIRSKNFTPVEPSTDYYFVYKNGNLVVIFYDENQNLISYTGRGAKTTPANCHYIKLRIGSMADPTTTYENNAGINYPSTETAYHKYGGDTVYKGTLNATAGIITITHAAADIGTFGWAASSGATTDVKFRYRANDLRDTIKKPSANNVPINAFCESYQITDANTPYSGRINDVICGEVAGEINIYTSQFETVDALKAGIKGTKLVYELAEPQTFQLTPTEIETLKGINNVWTDTNGDTSVKYKETGFERNDWTPATDYVEESRMEAAIRDASEIITGTTGGNVVLHLNNAGQPYEILILDKDDQTTPTTIENAERVWRWNAGGLGFSQEGYNSLNYKTALTRDGKFNAGIIQTGTLDASVVTIQHLTASMIEGGKLTLGGLNNQEGVFELKNEAGLKIGEMTSEGFIFYGAGPEGQRPYIKLNNEVGFAGYDKNDNKLFWVNLDEFRMKKCVAEEEINACGKIKFVPVTIRDQNNNIINDGVAEVAII